MSIGKYMSGNVDASHVRRSNNTVECCSVDQRLFLLKIRNFTTDCYYIIDCEITRCVGQYEAYRNTSNDRCVSVTQQSGFDVDSWFTVPIVGFDTSF